MVGGGIGDIIPIDEGLLKGLKAWDAQFNKINDTAAEIRDKMLSWLGLNPDGTVLDQTRWEHVLTAVKGIGVAMAAWTVSSGALKFLAALGVLEKTQAMTMAFGLTLAITGVYFAYEGIKKLVDGKRDLLTWVEALGGTFTGALGLASVIKAAKVGANLSWGKALAIGFAITMIATGVTFLTDAIRNKDWKAAIEGAITTAIGVITIVPSVKIALSKVGIDGAALGIKSVGNAAEGATASVGALAAKIGLLTAGFAGLATSVVGGVNNMKNFAEGTQTANQTVGGLVGSVGLAAASGAALGSVFPVVGTAAGALIGATAALGANVLSLKYNMDQNSEAAKVLKTATEETAQVMERATSIYDGAIEASKQFTKAAIESNQSRLTSIGIVEQYRDRLGELVDANGKVTGSENEVNTILGVLNENLGTNFQLNNGRITLNGRVYKSYEELRGEIDKYITTLKRQVQQEIITANYKDAMEYNRTYKARISELSDEIQKLIDVKYDLLRAGQGESQEYKDTVKNIEDLNSQMYKMSEQYQTNKQVINDYDANLRKTMEEGTEIVIDAENSKYEVLTKTEQEIRETMQMTSSQMVELAQNSTTEWKRRYDQLDQDQKAIMLSLSTTVATLSPTVVEEWHKMAETSEQRFGEAILNVDADTRNAIMKSITGTGELTPTAKKAWGSLAEKSQAEFAAALQQVEPTTRKEILKSISTTQENIEKNRLTWQDFSKQCPKEYEEALAELDPATSDAIRAVVDNLNNDISLEEAYGTKGTEGVQSYDASVNNSTTWAGINSKTFGYMGKWLGNLDMSADARTKGETNIASLSTGISNRLGWVQSSINQVRSTMSGVTDGTDPWNKGSNFIQGLVNGINSMKKTLSSVVSGIASGVSNIFNGKWIMRSPSRLAKRQGSYYMQGLELGFEAQESSLYKAAGNIADGVTVTMQDTLSGQTMSLAKAVQDNIQVQSTATISGTVQNNMKELIAEAVTNANVNVNIEAKTEEGVIVRKATDGINSYIRQTGEMPFPVLI